MELPADQRLLHDDLCAKLEQQQDKAQLIAFMGGVLGSLLRRRGDAAFLHAVQDAFTAGLAGRAWPQQVELAREVIGTVIAKRPEIALAWQRVSGEQPHPLARRAVDLSPDDLPEISVTPEEEAPPPVDSFAAFEAAVVDDVAGALGRRLALFALPPQRFPSPTYVHEQPFFLATEAFAQVARKFLAGVLLPLWRDQLHQLHARQGGLDPVTAVTQARTELWTLVAERLGNLAALSDSAQAKLAAARSGADDQPEFHLIEVPVSRKRVFSVLGVNFTLGSSTEMVTRKVAVEGPGKPTPDEMLALDLATRWHDMAAAAGLDLPPVADLAALQAVLTFDAGRLAEDMPGLLALARDPDVEHEALLDGIEAAVAGHPPAVADAVAVALFAHGVDGGFGYEELVRLGERWGADDHPLLADEIARRPRDLAFQVRDAMRQRLDRNHFGLTVVMLLEVWRVLAGRRWQEPLDLALTVFSAFPIAFAGDPAEAVFSEIGVVLAKNLSAPVLDAPGTIEKTIQLYTKVVPKASQE